MEELPEDILLQVARLVLEEEDGLRLWCKLSSACRRLWSFQLPSEPTYFLDDRLTDQGKPWALKRVQQAYKLSLTVSEQSDGQHGVLCDGGRAVMQASEDLTCTNLHTMALSTSGSATFLELCQPWVQKLLLGASSLTALSIHMCTIPRSPILQHLPLRHLEVVISSSAEWLHGFVDDVSHCRSLESLKIDYDAGKRPCALVPEDMRLPSMYLGGMPRLKHVRLDNCLPGRELALPADCSLFLDGSCYDDRRWHLGKVKHHTIVLRLLYRGLYLQWPQEIHSFSSLQYLELEMQQVWGGDLATLRHIPHVRVILEVGGDLGLTAGSWETLEVFCFGELRVGMSDMDSFVRDTRNFTFMGLSLPPYRESTVLLLDP